MSERLRVVLADDHVPTRAGVRVALEADGFEVCAEAGDAESAVAAVAAHRPDLCLLDLDMPGGGIAAAARMADASPRTAVVVLTVSQDDEDLLAALRAGARGFLGKEMNPDRLGAALRGVLAGEAAIPRRLVSHLIDHVLAAGTPRRRRDPRLPLSDREWEILDALCSGATTKQVARSLGLSDVTVRRHVSRMVRRLGVADRGALLRVARGDEGGGSD